MNSSYLNFKDKNILVVGDVMLDRYWHGGTSRISPEAPVQVVKVSNIEDRPGGAANVALGLAKLGVSVTLVGVVGDDENAGILKKSLEKEGVECHFVYSPALPTITKLRVISRHQQLIRLDFEEREDTLEQNEKILEAVTECLPNANAVIFSDYAKGCLAGVPDLIEAANKQNVPSFVDPKGNDFSIYQGATLVKPNLSEFEAIVGKCESAKEIVDKGNALREKHSWDALLVTRGEDGLVLLQDNHNPFSLATAAKEVFDVTGAGDTVIAALTAVYVTSQRFVDAVEYANQAAGFVVGKLGTASITSEQLEVIMFARSRTTNFGVLSPEQVREQIKLAQLNGEKVVFTNGCFDILHPGHVAYMRQAKALGDRLIVAVNTDASVKRLKGEKRPINDLKHRMAVLEGIGAIDWVTCFDEDTPKELIEALSPDVLVKGGDYTIDSIVGADHVINSGGEVKVLTFVDGYSTTSIIEKANG
ncbi:bifunctional D-glycero-beta-D-manno-heptose-7-phosphate kinase/D-glycero-beta-D-manno-heptose 1-phosphate adenylyltransferase HldE [Marinomonas mediterranea]|uniref:Bifunctional protein HldE n=1 Tax=Marinomonas mediterranea (strain ATCC 700492 / JCM 21426 / NBRC 103028 / MMB-1) TaxID=717774 RepID=F2K452_MARM1|nr:bifunctional D-glycero-beta-D-manno-heptose-7-phosphate kinase/D-glycero-beta-D-manno-heptose 1-phosphate adenylyltransferase HldE [Marinomonas mediterranea]ADZ92493.1 Bifunctional protein hldE [Marinomonas mediterranea MMB-1]WCN18538.1 bifunctional D-glycero-beta-D-manno-heptose-7-phosphate kinase/D-glycero-beta-D-manno-heptose 1-phosphate adenylyltransferase HldE [Marinomonas mediterranea MMB-1]